MSAMRSDRPSCPACHQADGVAKVSSIAHSGLPSQPTAQPGPTASPCAYQHLALPAAPVLRSAWNVQSICWLTLLVVLLLGGALGCYIAPQAITCCWGTTNQDAWPTIATDSPSPGVLGGMLALAWLLGGIWLVPLSILVIKREQTLRRAQYAVAMVEWLQAQTLWQALYYCACDDGVFLPGSQRVIPATQVQEFLFSAQKLS